MAEAKRITYRPDTDDLFIVFEEGRKTVGVTENASEYEVFADDDLLKRGIYEVVAVEILDMDNFDPAHADEIPKKYREAVADAYYRYRPDKEISATLTA